jgi:hypothetical protein
MSGGSLSVSKSRTGLGLPTDSCYVLTAEYEKGPKIKFWILLYNTNEVQIKRVTSSMSGGRSRQASRSNSGNSVYLRCQIRTISAD